MGLGNQGMKIKHPPKAYLEDLYIRQNKTPYQIGQCLHVGSNTIRRWLVDYKIPVKRPISKNEAFIKTLRNIIGGTTTNFVYHDSRRKKQGYKLMFSNQRSALAFLEKIEPYLILKRKQAELMIDFLKERINARTKKGNCAVISDRCWELIMEIGRLNNA